MTPGVLADAREMITEQYHYRGLLYEMTKRDLLLRYKQTVMGFGWAIFMPLINTAVFSVIFTRVAPIDVGVPYPLFAFTGLLVWNFFATSLRFSVSSLTSNTSLVTKVYFPREIFPFSAIIVCAVDSLVASLVMIGLMIYYRVGLGSAVAIVPFVLMIQIAFTAGISLTLAMANLYYRDIKYLFEVIVTVWMFATSVLYPTQMVGGRLGIVLRLNPMTHIIDAFRNAVLRNEVPSVASFAATAIVSLAIFLVSWFAFHRAEFQFAENV